MGLTPLQRIRMELGDQEEDGDTLFTDDELNDILERNPNPGRATYEGWRVKAAKLSNLVDTTEGNTSRKFSQLLAHAERMMKVYARSSGSPTEGRTRIGSIRRDPVNHNDPR